MNRQQFEALPESQRIAAQKRLIALGLYNGDADGKWGKGTQTAFETEEQRRVEAETQERKTAAEREERARQDAARDKELANQERLSRLKREEEDAKAARESKRLSEERAEREGKTAAEREARARADALREKELGIQETEAKARARRTEIETNALEQDTAKKKRYVEDAQSGLGRVANIASGAPALVGGTAVGMGMGKATNWGLDKAQESRNRVLEGVAKDRIAGLTTREGAREGAALAGTIPMRNAFLRTTARMLPHIGLGLASAGKGAELLMEKGGDDYFNDMINRGTGLGMIGAGSGIMKQGMRYGASPGVAPDARSIAIISSNQLRRNGIGPTIENAGALNHGPIIDADVIPDNGTKALPAPGEESSVKKGHAERLKSAAKAAGASGKMDKQGAATYVLENLSDENRAAVARELGVKPGPKFSERVTAAVNNMAKGRGASALAGPIAAGALAYAASPKPANASSGNDITGRDEALTNAGIAGGLSYGMGKLGSKLGILPALGTAGAMTTPFTAADAYSPDPERLAQDRKETARYMPSWMRPEAIAREAEDIPAMPERGDRGQMAADQSALKMRMPLMSASRLEIPEGIPAPRPDGSSPYDDAVIDRSLDIARGYAKGGLVSGGLHYDTGGRTDVIPMEVTPGSYIVPADVVSALGQGNTLAGIKVLDNMFPPRPEMPQPRAAGGRAADGNGKIPIIAAGGEYKIDPEHVAQLGGGDIQAGANMLDEWVKDTRNQHIETLSSLPGPAGSDDVKKNSIDRGLDIARRADGGISEEDPFAGMSPVDRMKLETEISNAEDPSPMQRMSNKASTLRDILGVTPVIGNVMSAQDAYGSAADAREAFERGDIGGGAGNAGLAAISGLGAVTGLPFGKMARNAAEAGRDTAFAIPAWHGSPHDFDKFSLEHIGKGEGAQAYGHGLYFAGNRNVAREYEGGLSKNGNDPALMAREALHDAGGDPQKALEALRQQQTGLDQVAATMQYSGDPTFGWTADAGRQAIQFVERHAQGEALPLSARGRLYRAELDVEPEDLLDWDKPLREQSEKVRNALESSGMLGKAKENVAIPGLDVDQFYPHRTGMDIHADLISQMYPGVSYEQAAPRLAAALRESGIPGIRYLDQGSRDAGAGSSNYVIFSDDLVKILGKE